jgi:hypothetical protein
LLALNSFAFPNAPRHSRLNSFHCLGDPT